MVFFHAAQFVCFDQIKKSATKNAVLATSCRKIAYNLVHNVVIKRYCHRSYQGKLSQKASTIEYDRSFQDKC